MSDLREALTDAIKQVEIGAGSEHYQHGRETMRDDVLSVVQSLEETSEEVEVGDAREAIAGLVRHWDDTCNGVDWLAGTPEEYAEAAIIYLALPILYPRPLLDIEQLAAALYREIWDDKRQYDEAPEALKDVCRRAARRVAELARPMPTREELAVAGHRWACLKRDELVHELDAVDYDRADEILEIWALLNGTDREQR